VARDNNERNKKTQETWNFLSNGLLRLDKAGRKAVKNAGNTLASKVNNHNQDSRTSQKPQRP